MEIDQTSVPWFVKKRKKNSSNWLAQESQQNCPSQHVRPLLYQDRLLTGHIKTSLHCKKVIPHPEWSKATLSTQLVAEELYLRIEDNKNKNLTTKTTRSKAVRKIHLQVFPWALFHLNGHQHGCEVSEWWKRDPSKDTLKIFRKKHRFVPSCLPIGMALAMEIVWISFDEE